jgi:hypothetical protein
MKISTSMFLARLLLAFAFWEAVQKYILHQPTCKHDTTPDAKEQP